MPPARPTQPPNLTMEGTRPSDNEVQANLRAMLLLRLLFSVGVFLLGPIFFRAHAPTLYLFTGALFFLTLLYAFLLKWGSAPRLFANIQIFADVLLVTFLIALTGWENSIFSFLYIIPITSASLFFQLRESISIALLSSILYSAVVLFHRYRLLPASHDAGVELFYTLYIRTIIFCIVGYLCGHLANLLKEQKEEVKELKNLRDLVLSSMNSGLITTDANNNIIYANRAAEEILGFPSAKMYNKNLSELFMDGQNGSLERMLEGAMSPAGDAERPKPELQARTADGRKVPIGFNLSAIMNRSGEPMGKVMVFSNLTRVKELERRLRATEKFRTAGELAAGIAHEIRNPLTSITGSIEMLVDSPELSEVNRRLLSVIRKESGRLNGIIEDFLAYAKRGSLDMKKENLCDIIKECMEMLDRGGKLSGDVRMRLVTPGQPAVVSADRSLMGQVFVNLLSNAVDAVDGCGTVSIKIETDTPNSSFCSVTIADTGPGIPQDRLSRVFEPFFTTKKNGVGIGLCVAERIVREHNGYIDIISEKGKGTSVTVVIPSRQACPGRGPDGDPLSYPAGAPEAGAPGDSRGETAPSVLSAFSAVSASHRKMSENRTAG